MERCPLVGHVSKAELVLPRKASGTRETYVPPRSESEGYERCRPPPGQVVMSRLKAFSIFLSLALLTLGIGFHNRIGKGFQESNSLKETRARLFGSASLAPPRSGTTVLWSADMETGDLSQWTLPDVTGGPNCGGGVFNSGVATASVDTVTLAHGGLYSAKLFVDARENSELATSGTRLFRW